MGRKSDGYPGSGLPVTTATRSPASLESRPGIFVVGAPSVGKRTLLSRLLSVDFSEEPDSWTGVLCHGWTIDTKYYSTDVCIWTAQLDEDFSLQMVPVVDQLDALVMVFDMNDVSSFATLKSWVSGIDIQRFDILVCVGNKADLLPGHLAHVEYRRRLQKRGESDCDPHQEFLDYGISETEGSSLLGEEEPSCDVRKSCLEWCSLYNIEFIEACASNADFDKCLSVDGDMQGVDRLFGALSAHMWPGMILKSGERIMKPSLAEAEEFSDGDSDYEVEYERLSAGSAEQWVGASDSWTYFDDQMVLTDMGEQSADRDLQTKDLEDRKQENKFYVPASMNGLSTLDSPIVLSEEMGTGNTCACEEPHIDGSDHEGEESEASNVHASTFKGTVQDNEVESTNTDGLGEDAHFSFEDLEQLMSEIGNMRNNLRLMPDFQRREMAAKLAMKMAAMFGESPDEDGYE